ncbi:MAG: diguanylate cyclase [Methyloprofundus sp.]|nr:diguanylate cyclase [Methyloprofundus sp.]
MSINNFLRIAVQQILLAVIYLLVAVIALEFAVIKGNATLIWPASGIALATLIRFGAKYAVGVFLGAFAAGIYAGDVPVIWFLSALGNSLEPLLAVYLLRYLPFSKIVYHSYDYLSLFYAGATAAILSALLGSASLLLAGFISIDQLPEIILRWWMADTLGILIVAPFLLLFSYYQVKLLLNKRAVEACLLIVASFLIALNVLAGWQNSFINLVRSDYLLIIPLVWSALRFGQTISSIIIAEYFIVGIIGLLSRQGMFIGVDAEPNLLFFLGYFAVTSLSTMLVAYVANERNILYQAINSSQSETYIFCEDDMHFEFVNQCALENQKMSLFTALKLTPIDLQIFLSEQQLRQILKPLQEYQVAVIDFETVLQREDGSLYPVEVHVQRVEYSNRHCYLTSVVDITERLEKENYLTLGNYVCELSPQAIMITDKDNLIVRVNAAFSTITGYQAEAVLGLNPSFLNSGRHDQTFYRALWHNVHAVGGWSGEIYNRRKNGELYLQKMTIKALHNPHGEIENYIAMFTDITQEREKSLHLKHLAEHDVLTNLPNKSLLQQEFNYALATAKRQGTKIGLLFIDLNDFKPINDNYGHTYGDALLQTLASRMQSCIRETDMVSRIGGDEFAIIVTNIESIKACRILSTKLKRLIAEEVMVDDISLKISTSIGMAIYPDQGDNLDELLKVADIAMYDDKKKMKAINELEQGG